MITLSLIAAMSKNRVIGRDNRLPWRLPRDLLRFKALTLGKPILMGRRTHESIGRPLPGRHNLVLSQRPDLVAPGCTIVRSLEEALAQVAPASELFIIGGASLYAQAAPLCERLYLTRVEAEVEGDTFFPEVDLDAFHLLKSESHDPDETHIYPYTFVELLRRPKVVLP